MEMNWYAFSHSCGICNSFAHENRISSTHMNIRGILHMWWSHRPYLEEVSLRGGMHMRPQKLATSKSASDIVVTSYPHQKHCLLTLRASKLPKLLRSSVTWISASLPRNVQQEARGLCLVRQLVSSTWYSNYRDTTNHRIWRYVCAGDQ